MYFILHLISLFCLLQFTLLTLSLTLTVSCFLLHFVCVVELFLVDFQPDLTCSQNCSESKVKSKSELDSVYSKLVRQRVIDLFSI